MLALEIIFRAGQENYTCFSEKWKNRIRAIPSMNNEWLTQSAKTQIFKPAWKSFFGKRRKNWGEKHLFRKVF